MVIPDKVTAFVNKNFPNASLPIHYGYSIYNLDEGQITHKVFWTSDRLLWVKTTGDGSEVVEAYKEFTFETGGGVISTSLDLLTLQPLEYYRKGERLGLSCRIKFDLVSNEELAVDYFGDLTALLPVIPFTYYQKAKTLPFDTFLYYGKKPYGHVVGVLEQGT